MLFVLPVLLLVPPLPVPVPVLVLATRQVGRDGARLRALPRAPLREPPRAVTCSFRFVVVV